MLRTIFVVALFGCGDPKPTDPDAPPVDAHVPPDGPPQCDLMGQPCTEDPFPAITYCHHDAVGHPDGVCLDDGTCRPICQFDGHRQFCACGTLVRTDRGSCVCEP